MKCINYLVHHAPGTGKRRQDEDAGLLGPAGHKLLGNKVHAVPQRGHQRHVRVAIETRQLSLAMTNNSVSKKSASVSLFRSWFVNILGIWSYREFIKIVFFP